MEQPTCKTCPFWDRALLDGGFCRATPPDPVGDWPQTKPSDWCGSHPAMTQRFIDEKHKALKKK